MVNEVENKYVLLNTKITIVVAGQFHPGVFTPDWFSSHQIVSKEDCDNAEIKYIEPSVIDIDFGWFRWYSDPQRAMVELKVDGYDDQMLDLVRSILTMFSYTKVSALGLNYFFFFNMNALGDWHELGHSLTPKDIWKSSFGHEEKHYGMKETAIQVEDFYGEGSVFNVTVKAANHVNDPKHRHRFAIEFNNHFDIPDQNHWNDHVENILSRYFEIKNHNIIGYKTLLSSILGGVQ